MPSMMMFDRKPETTGEWECMECGYIEEGVRARRPAICFECGAPDKALEFFPYEQRDPSEDEGDWDADDLDDDSDQHDTEEDDY